MRSPYPNGFPEALVDRQVSVRLSGESMEAVRGTVVEAAGNNGMPTAFCVDEGWREVWIPWGAVLIETDPSGRSGA